MYCITIHHWSDTEVCWVSITPQQLFFSMTMTSRRSIGNLGILINMPIVILRNYIFERTFLYFDSNFNESWSQRLNWQQITCGLGNSLVRSTKANKPLPQPMMTLDDYYTVLRHSKLMCCDIVAYLVSWYLVIHWHIVNQTLKNNFQWYFNRNSNNLLKAVWKKKALQNIVRFVPAETYLNVDCSKWKRIFWLFEYCDNDQNVVRNVVLAKRTFHNALAFGNLIPSAWSPLMTNKYPAKSFHIKRLGSCDLIYSNTLRSISLIACEYAEVRINKLHVFFPIELHEISKELAYFKQRPIKGR